MNTLYNQAVNDFKSSYYIYIPLTIILQSCVGSIAAMYILMNGVVGPSQYFQLTLCVILAMSYNGLVYAQIKAKIVFPVLIASLLVNILLIAINVYQMS